MLGAAIGEVLCADPLSLPILDRFAEVVVQDSTTIALPEALAAVWTGCGNGTPDAGNAALKSKVALDLRTGGLARPDPPDGLSRMLTPPCITICRGRGPAGGFGLF
ncbi:hypothetical protein [Kouleothrix sp.]|uniref:hypothetical protein n=1 Tax=Kouleothrix sp. TaxID=2779161 RepID=UPI00391D9A2A